jgi:crotonobetainyl-CoA:carnitine CoA-transferase CaiB-like acyl-CoA transferase
MADATSPLAGIVVLELGHSVAAPFAGQVLGDLGACFPGMASPGAGR